MSDTPETVATSHDTAKKSWLPAIDSPGYYLLLGAVAIFILGPLGGVTAAYMNFSLGFFVGGQVLAGILGSVVTYGYGAEGKHGANYMQTMAASVATMSAMAVLIQAMTWMGMPQPPTWQLIVFFTSVGMFGCGVGMLYTPILVDRMQLMYPSGYAVANILRALTDVRLLKQSIGRLGGGTLMGILAGLAEKWVPKVLGESAWTFVDKMNLQASTLGAGMIVGARIGIPAIAVGALGEWITPYLISIGWLEAGQPPRKILFIIALGAILGAGIVDMALIAVQAVARFREQKQVTVAPTEDWKQTNSRRLAAWVIGWGIAVVFAAHGLFGTPLLYVVIAIGLVFIFMVVNGISTGISDSNPISSAFVITVFILGGFGLKDPKIGLMAAAILLLSTAVGVDMQQDRSTGWRLGTNRAIQFRFQVIGIFMGAIMAVVMAKVFMNAFPVLQTNQFSWPHDKPRPPGLEHWASAMTFKFVGALGFLANPKPFVYKALWLGISIGLVTEALRKIIKAQASYRKWVASGKVPFAVDFLLDSVILPSPYASSFGGFVNWQVSAWFAGGGVLTSSIQTWSDRAKAKKSNTPTAESEGGELPEDMSATSLVGGGLIAGDSLAALIIGIWGLIDSGALGALFK